MNYPGFTFIKLSIFSGLLLFAGISCKEKISRAKIKNLKCEHLIQPVGIDSPAPRFTWQIDSDKHGLKQISYTDNRWYRFGKSGIGERKCMGFAEDKYPTFACRVFRPPLSPFTRYYWSVKIWDEKNIPSKWSQPVSFETGMMEPANWRGDWISDTRDIHLKPAPWFRKEFDAGKEIKSARAYIAVGGLYELYVNGQKAGKPPPRSRCTPASTDVFYM
jgi:alpha-L-rhamnosidase